MITAEQEAIKAKLELAEVSMVFIILNNFNNNTIIEKS